MTDISSLVGILAYGSLIDDPGVELSPLIEHVIQDLVTPFPVEFARMSSTRGNAPTLVPYATGATVRAAVLVVDAGVDEATDMLWRRETRTMDISLCYPGKRPDRPNAVTIEKLGNFTQVDQVLYTSIRANVLPLCAERLAELAIASVAKAKPGMDGISYLLAAKHNGIVTTLSPDYEAAILHCTETADLEAALERVQAQSRSSG